MSDLQRPTFTCTFCELTAPVPAVRKVRLQIMPWKMQCVYTCRNCEKQIPDFIQKLRAELLPE